MGIARQLEEVGRETMRLAEQGKIARFLTKAENARRISGLVEDVRQIMTDYQVCAPNDQLLLCLMNMLDPVATRYQ